MKRYIKSSKKFYGLDNKIIELDRETKSLVYEYSFDGDYYKGDYHIFVKFKDADGNKCLISKIYDSTVANPDNPYNLESGKSYQVSGYFIPKESSIRGDNSISYEIYQPRISGIKGSDGKEVILKFTYPSTASEDAQKLCEVLDQNNIEYKCYDKDGTSGYPIQFNVLRSGKTWNDIMRLINSVRPARYKQEKMFVEHNNGQLIFRDFLY
jgi:hypothetical protein